MVAQSEHLKPHQVLRRQVLGEWLAIFRDRSGHPTALQDRCIHRNGRLSDGKIHHKTHSETHPGCLSCPYHGWVYDSKGKVVTIPSEGPQFKPRQNLRTKSYPTREQEGFIYVFLAETTNPELNPEFAPFAMPYYQQPGWHQVRLIHRFANNVTNCAENFIDIPHTVSVHPGIFRQPQRQKLEMTVTRAQGTVEATYRKETSNLGWWSQFLNPNQTEIYHCDRFFMPNITSVEYRFGPDRHLFITSQSVPETERSTLVYTDVTFNYGLWSHLAKPLVWWTAKRIIAEDLKILEVQQDVIDHYGQRFNHSPADTIHVFVESIRGAIAAGQDPRLLPEKSVDVTFWV